MAGLLAGCGSAKSDYVRNASSVAPAKYDTEAELVVAGRAACLQSQAGESPGEIARSIVYWADRSGTGSVTRAEADRFVPYALAHCGYLLGPEAGAVADEATGH